MQRAAIAPVWHVVDPGADRCMRLDAVGAGRPEELADVMRRMDIPARVVYHRIPDAELPSGDPARPVRLRGLRYAWVGRPGTPGTEVYPNFMTCRAYLLSQRERAGLPPAQPQHPTDTRAR